MLIVEQRRQSRIATLQFLFGLEFHPLEGKEELEYFWKHNNFRVSVRRYAEKLIWGIIERQSEIDGIIVPSLKKWSWDRVGYIEKIILRIAVYEGGLTKLISPRIAIHEAIELAKMFGSEDAPRFVNGVLDRVFESQKWLEKED